MEKSRADRRVALLFSEAEVAQISEFSIRVANKPFNVRSIFDVWYGLVSGKILSSLYESLSVFPCSGATLSFAFTTKARGVLKDTS